MQGSCLQIPGLRAPAAPLPALCLLAGYEPALPLLRALG